VIQAPAVTSSESRSDRGAVGAGDDTPEASAAEATATRSSAAVLRAALPAIAVTVVLAIAAAAYFVRVGDVPSASGDEGNWMAMGHRLLLGLPTRLGPDARFVTLLFARMISWSYRLTGDVTIGAARGVLGASLLLGFCAVFALSWRMKARAVGAAIVAVVALHPWTVWWSRSVVTPYAISLVVALLGPLAWLHALTKYAEPTKGSDETPPAYKRHLGLVLAGQVLVLGLHFSPFSLVALSSCALWTLAAKDGRRALRTPGPWLALAGVLFHALPILVDVRTVVGQARPSPRLVDFGARAQNLVRSMIDGFSGEQTLRDYVGDNAYMTLGPSPTRMAVLVVLGAALWLALHRGDDGQASPSAVALRRFAPLYFFLSLLLLPLVLAPARDWWLATIDSERYFFTLLAPAALLVGSMLVRAPRGGAVLAAALCAYFALGPNRRAAQYFWHGGGPDHGYFSAHRGGGYRGYKVLAGPSSVTTAIYRACRDEARGEPMSIAFNDYAFHPIRVLIRVKPDHNLNSVYLRDASLARGRLLCVPLWPEVMFTNGHIPGFAVQQNRWTRDYVTRRMDGSRRIAAWSQPNGFPLVEVYVGRVSEAEAGHSPR